MTQMRKRKRKTREEQRMVKNKLRDETKLLEMRQKKKKEKCFAQKNGVEKQRQEEKGEEIEVDR